MASPLSHHYVSRKLSHCKTMISPLSHHDLTISPLSRHDCHYRTIINLVVISTFSRCALTAISPGHLIIGSIITFHYHPSSSRLYPTTPAGHPRYMTVQERHAFRANEPLTRVISDGKDSPRPRSQAPNGLAPPSISSRHAIPLSHHLYVTS